MGGGLGIGGHDVTSGYYGFRNFETAIAAIFTCNLNLGKNKQGNNMQAQQTVSVPDAPA